MLKSNFALTEAQAQTIVDRASPGRRVARLSAFGHGEISAVFDVELTDGQPGLVIKIYPDTLHWKMQKEILVTGLMSGCELAAPVPRILLADDAIVNRKVTAKMLERGAGKRGSGGKQRAQRLAA